jgi:hypothetical protein
LTWNKVHTLSISIHWESSRFERFFQCGPFEVSGSTVINNLFLILLQMGIISKGGPSTRRVIDFSDIEQLEYFANRTINPFSALQRSSSFIMLGNSGECY